MATWSAEALSRSPKVLYTFADGSGGLTDSSGLGHHATHNGTPTYGVSTGLAGVPVGITCGTGAYFSLADHADIDLGNGPFSIELIYKRPTDATANGLLGKRDGTTTPGYGVTITSGDLIRLEDGSGSSNLSSQTAALLNNTTWHHVVLTRASAANGTIFIDGTIDTPAVQTKTFTDNSASLLIGRDVVGQTSDGFSFAGLAIYKTQLLQADVDALFAGVTTAPAAGGNVFLMGWGAF